jgi:hypothetical protein
MMGMNAAHERMALWDGLFLFLEKCERFSLLYLFSL